ncbi:VOC family protein [Chloroflexota bacterium]
MEKNAEISSLPNPDHIGIVVRDVDKTVEFLSLAGVPGPWKVFNHEAKDGLVVGAPFKIKIGAAKVGSVVFELIQPLDSDSVWARFLESKGEGIQHLAFGVSSFDEWVSRLKAQGYGIVVGGRVSLEVENDTMKAVGDPNGDRWCYLENSSQGGGFIIEFMDNLDNPLGLSPLF